MRRREFIALLGACVTWPLAGSAQEPGRTYRLGFLTGAARTAPRIVAFFDELKVLGFTERQNLEIVLGGFDLRDDQYAQIASTLAKSAPDAIFCASDLAMRAVTESTHTIPVVGVSFDMVAAGFVRSLARPGGNVTGVSFLAPELNSKRQEILLEAVPIARRIGLLAQSSITRAAETEALWKAGHARGLEVAVFTVETPEEIAPIMDKAKAWGADALNVLAAPVFSFNRKIVFAHAAALGLPAIYDSPEMAEEGGLVGYGPRLTLIYRQLARLLGKVLRGVKPEDLPVEQPTGFELVINLMTAKGLGLTIPEALLARADKVIE